MAEYKRSRDISNHVKSHEASTKRLDRQVTALRSDLAALKANLAKEAAKTKARDDATLARILS